MAPLLAAIRSRPYLVLLVSLCLLLGLSSLHRPSPNATGWAFPGLLPSGYRSSTSSVAGADESSIWRSPGLLREQERRYAHLRNPHVPGSDRISPGEGKYLFVTLTRNIEDQLPELMDALLVLTKYLGPNRVRFSIYEGPSSDVTPNVLEHVLVPMLTSLGVPDEEIVIKTNQPDIDFNMVNRIQALAVLRNEALAPLWNRPTWDDTAAVVFFNDVYLRARDVLELLHQHVKAGEKAKQETGVTTGIDWWQRTPAYYYDVWVARTDKADRAWAAAEENRATLFQLEGDLFYPIEGTSWAPSDQFLISSLESKAAYDNLRPFQVFSSWAGMAVLAATPFLAPHNLRFRRSDPSGGEGGEGECAASECELLCRDFWKAGWGRAQVVPSVQLAYERHIAKETAQKLTERMDELQWWDETPPGGETFVDWRKEPPEQVKCYPWPEKVGLDGNVWEKPGLSVPYLGYGT